MSLDLVVLNIIFIAVWGISTSGIGFVLFIALFELGWVILILLFSMYAHLSNDITFFFVALSIFILSGGELITGVSSFLLQWYEQRRKKS